MNSIIILLLILTIILFFLRENKQESFVQVKSDYNPNKNARMIKPIQVTPYYIQPGKTYERDDPVYNPTPGQYNTSHLIEPNNKSELAGDSNGMFEQSTKNKKSNNKNNGIKMPMNKPNPKGIRPGAGIIKRPLEVDSTPSSNTQVEKPYMTKPEPQSYSHYLDYGSVDNINDENHRVSNTQLDQLNQLTQLTNIDIAKKLIKKAANLSIKSIEDSDPLTSVQNANYSIGYLDALCDLIPDSEIKNLVNINLEKLIDELIKIQANSTAQMVNACSNLTTDKEYLLKIINELH
jgi:hypothetical protein